MAFASWLTGHSRGRLYLYRRGRLYLLPSSSVKASCSKMTPVRLVLKWLSVSERTEQRAFQSRSTSPAGKAPLYLKPVSHEHCSFSRSKSVRGGPQNLFQKILTYFFLFLIAGIPKTSGREIRHYKASHVYISITNCHKPMFILP